MTLAEPSAITDAAALALALRARMAALVDDPRTGDSWAQVAADTRAAITALAAAVRSLDVRLRRARGQRVIALRRP